MHLIKVLTAALLLAGCSPDYPQHFGKTTLPGVVQVGTEYTFDIQLPPVPAAAGFEWRYNGKVIYRSIVVFPKTETITTEMFFYAPGYYTLVLYVEDRRREIHTFKSIYLAEYPASTYGRRMPID